MTVAYIGTGFHGFAAQKSGVTTVAGTLIAATEKVLGVPIDLTCAGRTDAGVHAWGQVVSFDVPEGCDLAGLQRSLNKLLGPSIVVRSVDAGPDGFDARRWATARAYRYTVVNRPVPDPFLAHLAWHIEEPLDLRAMQLACDPLIGEHDFTSFCKKPPSSTIGDPPSMVRRVHDARWTDLGEGVLRFEIEASAFCHQMVRSIVGTMVAVGKGRKRAGDMAWTLRSQDRSLASSPAPPQGLTLWSVAYDLSR
ncbi:MAG: tRNA pseudouridine38-40 synthase [Acidimicrobiaceae bacterium]|jgi:tRNA pseudouridine38-40 synthase|nr:tRNA pseudouridine38-40 synthase [Acidimicrobiaceae bacterium]MDQ1446727.1 tRNA pseudouridine38-40 synthase [Acidimicrobiaceae bacterium]